jgi:uncharacterized protein (TIGR03435 family)
MGAWMRQLIVFVVGSVLSVASLGAAVAQQTATSPLAPSLKYDVVTVKENKTGSNMTMLGYVSGDVLKIENATLMTMLSAAFDRHDYLIEGVPKWATSEHFDVQGKILDGTPDQIKTITMEQRRAMLRIVLADRFGLKVHLQTRDKPEYELVVAKGGSKLKASTETQPRSGMLNWDSLDATQISSEDLAKDLAMRLEKPVVNKTGLAGRYDVKLRWSVEGQNAGAEDTNNEDSAPSIFTAVKETLGLELRPIHGPVEVLIVESANLPGAN